MRISNTIVTFVYVFVEHQFQKKTNQDTVKKLQKRCLSLKNVMQESTSIELNKFQIEMFGLASRI